MIKKKFRIGSKPRYRKSAEIFWRDNYISGKLSLADISTVARRAFSRISKLNWIKLLKGVKLVMEIVEKIRTLLFCKQLPIVIGE
ncbi:MAG: hypothetical protein ABR913_02880 [Sedimentisphaerales bacterium]|jgi:hypothetical protein